MAKKVLGSIVPHASLIRKLGRRSRQMPSVVAELVDNAIDSWIDLPASFKRASKELLIRIDPSTHWFTIQDNAGGMLEEELFNALRVAYTIKADQPGMIGSHGFGLKSAAMYIGNQFEIFTMSYKKPNVVLKLKFDADAFEKKAQSSKNIDKAWETDILVLSKSEAFNEDGVMFPDGHGTVIKIANERYKSGLKDGIIKRLRRTFSPLLEPDEHAPILKTKVYKDVQKELEKNGKARSKIKLVFDGESLKAGGPMFEAYIPRPKGEEIYDSDEKTKGAQPDPALDPTRLKDIVWIKPVTLPSGRKVFGVAGLADRFLISSRVGYGLDLITRGRVIETSVTDDVGVPLQNRYGKVVGQLYLEDFPTDHQKVSFLRDEHPQDWGFIAAHVRKEIDDLLDVSSDLAEPSKALKKLNTTLAAKAQSGLQKAARSSVVKAAFKASSKPPKPRVLGESSRDKMLTNSQLAQAKPVFKFQDLGSTADVAIANLKMERNFPVVSCVINTSHQWIKDFDEKELALISQFMGADILAQVMVNNQASSVDRLADFLKFRAAILKGLKL